MHSFHTYRVSVSACKKRASETDIPSTVGATVFCPYYVWLATINQRRGPSIFRDVVVLLRHVSLSIPTWGHRRRGADPPPSPSKRGASASGAERGRREGEKGREGQDVDPVSAVTDRESVDETPQSATWPG